MTKKKNRVTKLEKPDEACPEIKTFSRICPKFESSMMFTENRLASFKNWPFPETAKCCAKNMSEAGFYWIGVDSAKCYYCSKELDGWEENDDPTLEHEKHAAYCPFVKYKAIHRNEELNVGRALDLETARVRLVFDREFDKVTGWFIERNVNELKKFRFSPY